MRRYYAVITNSRSTSNPFTGNCNPPLFTFTSKKERDNFVKIHTNDLEKAFPVSTSIVRKYYKDYE